MMILLAALGVIVFLSVCALVVRTIAADGRGTHAPPRSHTDEVEVDQNRRLQRLLR